VGDVEQLHRVLRPNRSGAGAVHTAILSAWTSLGQITKGQDDTQEGITTRVRLRTEEMSNRTSKSTGYCLEWLFLDDRDRGQSEQGQQSKGLPSTCHCGLKNQFIPALVGGHVLLICVGLACCYRTPPQSVRLMWKVPWPSQESGWSATTCIGARPPSGQFVTIASRVPWPTVWRSSAGQWPHYFYVVTTSIGFAPIRVPPCSRNSSKKCPN